MEKWFKSSIENRLAESIEKIGYYRGQKDAYESLVSQMNPDKTCQVCGYEYRTWGSEAEKAARKATHDAEHKPVEPTT